MVDPNTGTAMYESKDIIDYLFKNYGPGEVPRGLSLRNSTIANSLGMMGRMGAGSRAKASTQPPQPLDLWGYEASPFVGLVKEVLCELEIPYVQHSTPRGSAKRQELFERKGLQCLAITWLAVDHQPSISLFFHRDLVHRPFHRGKP